ncbi:MAG: UDP-glucose 4-epimerase GalE [Cyanobacteria bacterium J06627_32]
MAGKPKVLVTGGAGYIGSHAVLALVDKGYDVVVLDNLVYGHRDIVETVLDVELVVGELGDVALLQDLFSRHQFDAVMHFAAYAYVGESMSDPGKYYRNNVSGTLTLLEAMASSNIHKIVFSSTCATYGIPETTPILESAPQNPINPYGFTKLVVERILKDFDRAHQIKSVVFRYFNAAGADPAGRLGEDHAPETHLIPLVLMTALGKRDAISIFGTDYPTPDGTCIRDYIHVSDLASAHVLGLEYLLKGGDSNIFNLGNEQGFSVKTVIDTAKEVTGRPITVIEDDRRPGDPPILVGSAAKASEILGWQPAHGELSEIVKHAWQWHQRRHGD